MSEETMKPPQDEDFLYPWEYKELHEHDEEKEMELADMQYDRWKDMQYDRWKDEKDDK